MSHSADSEPPPTNVLIVDDNRRNLLALEALLEPLGHRVLRAATGEEALNIAASESLAVILMDVKLPGLDGFETTARMRERERTRDVPVIFITANYTSSEHSRRGHELGAIDYITKPFDPDILRAKVATVVALYQRGEVIKRQAEIIRATERTAARAEAARRAEEVANRTKDVFIGVLGHDLRNPLWAITMATRLMLHAGSLSEAQRETVRQIAACAARMDRLIKDVLDFTRGRLGGGIPVQPKAMDMGIACKQVIDELHIAYPRRPIVFERFGDLRGTWDYDRVAQAVGNLIENALKHATGEVSVVARDAGEQVVVAVHNHGAAIPPDKVPMLFEPFHRGDSDEAGGLGLGLYIVREIMQAHGAHVEVTSSEDDGTTFTLTCPRQWAHENGARIKL